MIAPFAMPVTISMSSSATNRIQGNFVLTDGKEALHHVLFEVLCQPWYGPLAEALERSGFNEIQDVLENQAERDILTFLDASNVITPLPQVQKNMLLDVKLFSCYCEENGKPIMDWTKNSKADFNSIALYREVEKVTIPPFPKQDLLMLLYQGM